jgi:hypothetical protein
MSHFKQMKNTKLFRTSIMAEFFLQKVVFEKPYQN